MERLSEEPQTNLTKLKMVAITVISLNSDFKQQLQFKTLRRNFLYCITFKLN